MTRIDFYFNVGNPSKKIIELTQLAVSKQRQVMLFAYDATQAEHLSQCLWQGEASSFLPHFIVKNSNQSEWDAEVNPIVIDYKGDNLYQDDVLINLQRQTPKFFSRFRHLIELVGMDEEDKKAARLRYKFYRDRGYEIKNIDLAFN